ncbi:UDP-N-acetylglucosamine 2-epimerase [Acinetobacter sp. ANC 5414]|uniref:UDP-N-acetylglucosamine 2-epimerase n=1 Tax=Acinetobacter sp. ANC 5414 TaxID=2731251 RepID=UPI00148FCA7F|nr:UDP-N-acetylglucosamine 2-epimerase [Acinetobacter sp. ANC 5414]NNH00044.1 UDP-N-acetylglucosamine 2-epimerase (hydrolyzing) [Acinetobacter sp. ANC 5414]
MKKFFFITGTRADFGKIKPLMNYIEGHPEFELHVFVTGMHMMQRYGGTFREVIKQGYVNVYLQSNQYLNEPMSSVLGNTISAFSKSVEEIKPDMIVVHGDRLEALAGATVGALANCLVCHIEGGELSGTVDDIIRHSISKLSHIHMVANESAKSRLIQMGESENKIFIIGSPDLDVMSSSNLPKLEDVKRRYNIDFDKYAICMFHPVTTEYSEFKQYATNFFKAINESEKNYIVIYPNNDLGSDFIIDEIKKLDILKNKIFPSVEFESFLVLLENSEFIIGNSSAGIREASFYGVPTVNVGTRQNKRFFSKSIINCSYVTNDILDAINKCLLLENIEISHEFGDGSSISRFKDAINSENFWNTLLQKDFVEFIQ